MPGDDIPVGSELADERVDLREGNRLVMVEPGAHAARAISAEAESAVTAANMAVCRDVATDVER